MEANNGNGTTNSMDGELKENSNTSRQVEQDPPLDGTAGGQVKGGVTAQSGNRMEDENENGPEDN
jgi:hypothetical protein